MLTNRFSLFFDMDTVDKLGFNIFKNEIRGCKGGWGGQQKSEVYEFPYILDLPLFLFHWVSCWYFWFYYLCLGLISCWVFIHFHGWYCSLRKRSWMNQLSLGLLVSLPSASLIIFIFVKPSWNSFINLVVYFSISWGVLIVKLPVSILTKRAEILVISFKKIPPVTIRHGGRVLILSNEIPNQRDDLLLIFCLLGCIQIGVGNWVCLGISSITGCHCFLDYLLL